MEATASQRSPGLDGLRGLAILLVLAGHLLPRRLGEVPWGGVVGVTLFFVLSGFLITRLLQRELDATADVDLRAFYVRRAARLLPALVACLAAVSLAAVFFRARHRVPYGPEPDQLPLVITIVLLFLANVAVVVGPWLTRLDPFKPAWSLAVEEQYYLLWPLLLRRLHRLAAPRRRRLLAVALVLLGLWQFGVTAASWRTNDPAITRWAYHGLDTNLFPLLVGSVLGLRAAREPLPTFAWPVLPLLALIGLCFVPHAAGGTLRPLVALLSAWAIVGVSNQSTTTWLARGPLPWLGTISYALYLWHIPVLSAPWHLLPRPAGWPLDVTRAVAALALTVAIATLSWFAVERPVGGWIRRRFSRDSSRRSL